MCAQFLFLLFWLLIRIGQFCVAFEIWFLAVMRTDSELAAKYINIEMSAPKQLSGWLCIIIMISYVSKTQCTNVFSVVQMRCGDGTSLVVEVLFIELKMLSMDFHLNCISIVSFPIIFWHFNLFDRTNRNNFQRNKNASSQMNVPHVNFVVRRLFYILFFFFWISFDM